MINTAWLFRRQCELKLTSIKQIEPDWNRFTLRGSVDDPTATIVVTITATNGNTSVVSGEVERSGVLWVENLPLNNGTNWITLNVTNAAGWPNATNLCVVKSDMTLVLTNIDGDLWQPTVNVTGLISPWSGYCVWVNGIKGTNNGDGTWNAANVPVSSNGVASFDMSAVNGTDPNSNTNLDKPAELYMESYMETDGGFYGGLMSDWEIFGLYTTNSCAYTTNGSVGSGWADMQFLNDDGLGGWRGFWNSNWMSRPITGVGTNSWTNVWTESDIWRTESGSGNDQGPWLPPVWWEHCRVQEPISATTAAIWLDGPTVANFPGLRSSWGCITGRRTRR